MGDVFSKEIPQLMQTHLDHLLNSSISIDVIKERGYKSVLGRKELESLGFSSSQRRIPGILIPLRAPDGSPAGHQYRPDEPLVNDKGKVIKYVNPPESSLRLDMPLRCQVSAGDPRTELWATEGAKKADSLASQGACSINLSGVWGFKGKNRFGATTFLADFDYIALKGRAVYLVFDSDITTKPQVRQAMLRLKEHLERKGAQVHIVQLPHGPDDAKTGVDDYLGGGHSIDDIKLLVVEDLPEPPQEDLPLHTNQYRIEQGCFCMVKTVDGQNKLVPLCNFTAQIEEEVVVDDGIDEMLYFVMKGALRDGRQLPQVQIKAASFPELSWVTKTWGSRAVIGAGSAMKDHLRAAIQLSSSLNGSEPRHIFTHTGWRNINGDRVFLTGSGALGREGVEVHLEDRLGLYRLPTNIDDVNPVEAVQASLRLLDIGKPEVMYSLWASMYLSPLSEVLEPAFTVWLLGRTGSFKSVLSALTLCHFGNFDYLKLPAAWRNSANQLEKTMAVLRDLPLVIDDFPPGASTAMARELELKAEIIIRGQGNRAGRGTLKADRSFRSAPAPRGLVITSGEQLPYGESAAARLFVVEVEPSDIDKEELTRAQAEQHLYSYSMSNYVLWLRDNWEERVANLQESWTHYRNQAVSQGIHLRLPAAVAWLYIGFESAMMFASSIGAIDDVEAAQKCDKAWDIFIQLADRQGWRVDEERPSTRFIEAFTTLLTQRKIVLIDSYLTEPQAVDIKPGQVFVGWHDDEYYYLMPLAVFGAVGEFYHRSGRPFTFKDQAVLADLARLNLLTPAEEMRNGKMVQRNTKVLRIEEETKRVIWLKKSSINEKVPEVI